MNIVYSAETRLQIVGVHIWKRKSYYRHEIYSDATEAEAFDSIDYSYDALNNIQIVSDKPRFNLIKQKHHVMKALFTMSESEA